MNEEAARLFMESYDEYFTQARIMTSVHAAKKDLYKVDESAHVTETGVLGLSQVPNAKQEQQALDEKSFGFGGFPQSENNQFV